MISSSERYNAHPSIISESSTDKKKELWAPRFTQRVEFFFIIILLSSGSLVKAVFRVDTVNQSLANHPSYKITRQPRQKAACYFLAVYN